MTHTLRKSAARYSRLRVTTHQRHRLEIAFNQLLANGGTIGFRGVEQGMFSTVYTGLILNGNATYVEAIVSLVDDFR